ncbi:MAG: NifU family protein [Bacilli bacterium]
MNDVEKRITLTLEKIRPYLNSDGGDVTFVKFKDGVAYVKLTGACAGCMYATITLKQTVEAMLTSEIPEVITVENYEEA